jgi:hypothetical protein
MSSMQIKQHSSCAPTYAPLDSGCLFSSFFGNFGTFEIIFQQLLELGIELLAW